MTSILTLRAINKGYGTHSVIRNLTLDIASGTMLAITGKSGSGKTTMLNIMGLIERPDSGQVHICGRKDVKPNTHTGIQLLRNHLGYLFQNFALLDDESIDRNLDIPLMYRKLSKEKKQSLKRAALKSVGIENPIAQKVHELSGGEQQRVSIARLLLKPCDIILADEPTGSLDQENRDLVMDILKRMNQRGKTIVIATHDPYVVRQCGEHIDLLG